MKTVINLLVLFFVIFDPFMSMAIFYSLTQHLTRKEKTKAAFLALTTAAILSYAVLIWGYKILALFNVNLADFKVAGGIVLSILGIKMSLCLIAAEKPKDKTAASIAVIIGSPLITGPAAITAIIISVQKYNMLLTGSCVTVILVITGFCLLQADRIHRMLGDTIIRAISTMLGLITLSWGIFFIREGLILKTILAGL